MKQTFEAAVAAFAPGDRYGKYLSVVRLGLNEGRDPEAVAAYIMDCAPGGKRPNLGDIRRAIQYALTHDRGRSSRQVGKVEVLSPEERKEREERRRLLLPSKLREFVPVTLRDYGRTTAFTGTTTARVFGETLRLSDADLKLDEAKYRGQAARQLRALYPSGGTIWAGTILKPEYALAHNLKIKRSFDGGSGIVDALDLADRIERGELPTPTHISLNPQTGQEGKTSSGSPSFDCAETIATYRFALVEFDELKNPDGTPSPEQVDIVAGLADYSFERDDLFNVAAVVYSGGKSVHVALRLPDGDLAEYRRMCAHLRDLFASADDPRFRADPAGLGEQPTTHLRLAGAVRPETGRRQRLCYCVP